MAWLLLGMLLQDSAHGPKIADARMPRGAVTVTRDQQALEVRQVARRIVNGDVYDSDQVVTGDGGSVDLIFSDDSRVSMEANTQIVVEQRRLREPQGPRSIGRRIQILTGRVASDIVPSADVGTEFVTPAGTAAVRGTITEVGVAGPTADAFFDMGNGRFLLTGGQGLFEMPAGTHGGFTVNPDGTIAISNLDQRAQTGAPMMGRLGATQVQIQPGGELNLRLTPQGFQVIDSSGAQTSQNGSFADPAPGSTIFFSSQPLFDASDPLVPSSVGGANPAGTNSASTLDVMESDAFAGAATDAAQSLATAIGPVLIDDFNRPDASTIGNGWVEDVIGGSALFAISNGRAQIVLGASPSEAQIRRDIGRLGTFDISARFTYNGDVEIDLDVNFDPILDLGVGIAYFPLSTLLTIEDGAGSVTSFGAGNGVLSVPANEPFVMRLSFDGTTICAHMLHEADGHTFDACVAGTNGPGTHVSIEAANFVLSGQSITVDDVVQNPAP